MLTAVITGASTGIGLATAKHFIAQGYHVFGSVRKSADAERLTQQLGNGFTPLLFDVRDADAINKAAGLVRTHLKGHTLQVLVNNAGIAIGGPLLHQPIDEFRQHIEINLIGALTVIQAFAPLLGADRTLQGKPGRIINVSTMGGKIGAPFLGAYAAAKHGLEGMSESLRRELLLYGIDVIIIGPGGVITPIWDKAEQQDPTTYSHTDYVPAMKKFLAIMLNDGRNGLTAEYIAKVIYKASTVDSPRVRYALVKGKFVKYTLPLLLPKRWVDRLIGREIGLLKN